MIVVAKFKKTFPACMISHIDLLRIVNRIFRRAGIEVKYSEGFNPHMEMFFGPPLPLGVESICEYVTVVLKNDCRIDLQKLNACCPEGMVFENVLVASQNPNLAAVVDSARYEVLCDGVQKVDADSVLSKTEYVLTYEDKGKTVSKDVRHLIKDIKVLGSGRLELVLCCGNINLKAERLLKGLSAEFEFSLEDATVTKTESFVKNDKTDVFLQSFAAKIE